MPELTQELKKECLRQEESCLYTSTSLFIWLRCLRVVKMLLVGLPLIFGSIASGKLLVGGPKDTAQYFPALCSFLASVIPSLYVALKFDERLEECVRLSAEFKNLRDEFRYAANVHSLKAPSQFQAEVDKSLQKLHEARKASFTAPEWCFKWAQRKIAAGHYAFGVDEQTKTK